ncbi:MAG: histidine phosphatase family protein [Planctomycetota bacterium]|nr:histidine phosphatase family protein [Planctomycetota bacterium]MDA1248855.1 histidine phosphatase family protein [Planctomycetota bacterium]
MKTLIVLRHGKAEHHSAGQTDFQRALAERGMRDSERVGQLLAEKNLVPDAIVSSSAKRARMTADQVASASGFPSAVVYTEAIYEAGVLQLLSVVQEIEESAKVALIVGHNPGFWGLVERLSGSVTQFPTCAWAQLEIDVEHWGEVTHSSRAKLATLWYPKLE